MVMPELTFNVAQLLKEPIGATRTGEVSVDLRRLVPEAELDAADSEQDTPEPILSGPVRLMHTNDGVLVQGDLNADLVLPCSRCLEPVEVPLEIKLEEIFTPTIDVLSGQSVKPEEEDQALWIDAHHILDLTEVLRQDVLVSLPMHLLCREECRGLCPTCGQNWNEGSCDCEPEPDPRWAQLSKLLGSDQSE